MDNYHYYKEQLYKINLDSEYTPSIKIHSDKGSTNNLSLNKYSATVLIDWLTRNFIEEQNKDAIN